MTNFDSSRKDKNGESLRFGDTIEDEFGTYEILAWWLDMTDNTNVSVTMMSSKLGVIESRILRRSTHRCAKVSG